MKTAVSVWFTALMLLSASVSAQISSLPISILQKDELSESDKREVKAYVLSWTNAITKAVEEDEPDNIINARDRLVRPAASGSEGFRSDYAKLMAEAIKQATENNASLSSRLNLLIATADVQHPELADILIEAVDDQNPAIRYWGAAGLKKMTSRYIDSSTNLSDLPANVQAKIGQALLPVIAKDKEDTVFQNAAEAAARIATPGYADSLLEALDKRVNLYLQNPTLSITGPAQILKGVSSNYLGAQPAPPRASLEKLVAVTSRYQMLFHRLMQGAANDIDIQSWQSFVIDSDATLVYWTTNRLGLSEANLPEPALNPGAQLPVIRLRINNWQDTLTKELGIKKEDLDVERLP